MKQQKEITSAHLETINLVMLKRISKGFSAKTLSFFIGAEPNFVEQVESLLLPVYSSEDLERIALALEEKNHKTFYARVHDDTVLNVIKQTHDFNNKQTHSYFSIDENKEECLLFMLTEVFFGDFYELTDSNENLDIATDAIDVLMRAGYFEDTRSGIDILHAVNHFIVNPLDPFYIELAIIRSTHQEVNEKELSIIERIIDGNREYQES